MTRILKQPPPCGVSGVKTWDPCGPTRCLLETWSGPQGFLDGAGFCPYTAPSLKHKVTGKKLPSERRRTTRASQARFWMPDTFPRFWAERTDAKHFLGEPPRLDELGSDQWLRRPMAAPTFWWPTKAKDVGVGQFFCFFVCFYYIYIYIYTHYY